MPQRAERSSTEIVHSLFGPSVGLCWGDFSCSHHRQRGRLYASSNVIAFFSNLFGFEQRLCLQLADVAEIKPYRSTSVSITTLEGEQYIFKSFSDRELVVALILQLKQKTRLEEDEPMLNDPIMSQSYVDDSRLDMSKENAASEHHASEEAPEESSSPPGKEGENETSSDDDSMHMDRSSPEADPQTAWEDAKQANDPPYNETTLDVSTVFSRSVNLEVVLFLELTRPPFCSLQELLLPCTLDEFFALFLADNAPHSLATYQESVIGDSELVVSTWSAADDVTLCRSIHFRHPLALGVGPSSALAERRQRFRRYGEYGFYLETTTNVKGIIASDSFYVDDKWIIEPSGDTNVTLTVRHQVRFTKRTMLKSIILKSTNAEVQAWFAGYSKMLLASLEEKGSREIHAEKMQKEKS